ncbi:MAG: 3'-5' exonuclease, partial [Pseudomonadota bacterium]|nr:3'-5' exonuclease [Pseudomonadota bacterium]
SKEENLENIDKLTDKDIRLKIFKNKIINDNYSIWKNNIRKYPIHDVLDDIYNKLNIFNICKDTFSYKQYHIIENNLNSFLNLSLNHNSGRYITPLNFLYFLENIDAESSKTDIDNLNALRLYTIHGSKGLESPVVFVSQTYHKINGKIKTMDIIPLYENNNSIYDIFIFMQGFKENEKFSKFYSKHLEDVKREEENILYVACTRAKQQLIVTGYSDSNKDSYFNFLNL